MNNIETKIQEKLSKYIGFNINELLSDDIDMMHIFGGAIRDIIANKKIHDIDILCLPDSKAKIIKILKSHDFIINEKISLIDIQRIYDNIKCIFSPITLTKVIDGDIRYIQLITPASTKISKNRKLSLSVLFDNFFYLLGQVDLINCAVHYSHNFGLRESHIGAIKHCQQHTFFELNKTEMNTDRTEIRKRKFKNRGWINLDENLSDDDKKQLDRHDKLTDILQKNKNYYMPTAISHNYPKKEKDGLEGLLDNIF